MNSKRSLPDRRFVRREEPVYRELRLRVPTRPRNNWEAAGRVAIGVGAVLLVIGAMK